MKIITKSPIRKGICILNQGSKGFNLLQEWILNCHDMLLPYCTSTTGPVFTFSVSSPGIPSAL